MYRFLIFDADNTLFDFNRAEEEALRLVLRDSGVEIQSSHLKDYKAINKVLWEAFEKNSITQAQIKSERFRRLFDMYEINSDVNKSAEDYLVYLSRGAHVIDGAQELIVNLKNKYKLGLLTNGIPSVQHPRLAASVFSEVFDAVVVSGDTRFSKPDKRIFELLAQKASHSTKDDVLMIGDSLTSDIKGGINYGIKTCWYNPDKKINKTDIEPTFEINDLIEIYEILDRGKI